MIGIGSKQVLGGSFGPAAEVTRGPNFGPEGDSECGWLVEYGLAFHLTHCRSFQSWWE